MADDKQRLAAALDWLDRAEAPGGEDDDWLGVGEGLGGGDAALREQLAVEATLRQLGGKIHAAGLDELMRTLGPELERLFSVERATLFVVDRAKQEVFTRRPSGAAARFPLGPHSLPGFVAATGRIVVLDDVYDRKQLAAVSEELRFDRTWDEQAGSRTRQALLVPVKAGHHTEGVVELDNHRDGRPFTARHKRLLMEIAEMLAAAFSNQRRRSRLAGFDRLLATCLVDEAILEKAADQARREGGSIGGRLVAAFSVPKKEVLASLAEHYRVPAVDLAAHEPPPAALLGPFTRTALVQRGCAPIGEERGRVVVACVDPRDVPSLDEVARRLERPILAKVALQEDLVAYVDRALGTQGAPEPARKTGRGAAAPAPVMTDLGALLGELDLETPAEEARPEEAEVKDGSSGLVRLVNQIIQDAHARGVSDIHVEPYPDEDVVVRFRVDGVCQTYTTIPRRFARALISRLKIMAELDIAERRLPQDGKIRFKKYGGLDIELRVATLPTAGGLEDCVLRILAASRPLPLDAMGFLPGNIERFERAIAQPYGLVLCVGPTGSGKTTTLHSALGSINTRERKIWTAEDPVEITQRGLRQVQVHPKIGFTFARALRAFLRADPDVIMIGEMRDRETAEAAVEASLTGHLVLSTLHTNSAPETVTRLLDMGLDPYAFGDSLLAVLAQRLVRRLCTCKRPARDLELAELVAEFGAPDAWARLGLERGAAPHEAVGCEKCGGAGYKGRLALHELLTASGPCRRLICKGADLAALRELAAREGMTTLRQDGIRKVLLGLTDVAEVRRVCVQSDEGEEPRPPVPSPARAAAARPAAARQAAPRPASRPAAGRRPAAAAGAAAAVKPASGSGVRKAAAKKAPAKKASRPATKKVPRPSTKKDSGTTAKRRSR